MIAARHPDLGDFELRCDGSSELLFTENETNAQRLWGTPNARAFVKDAFHRYVVDGAHDAVNPDRVGSKGAARYRLALDGGASVTVGLRLCRPAAAPVSVEAASAVFTARIAEADAFYASITPPATTADQALVMRQALAGTIWGKQYYFFDLDRWLEEHQSHPLRGDGRADQRNRGWFHMINDNVISMPDKWEYPWYASGDLAFHTVALSMVDIDFAKDQLQLMLRELYLHPNGQLPAYEWNSGAGLGASRQTGWTGLVARIIQVLGYLRPSDVLSDAISGNLVYRASRP